MKRKSYYRTLFQRYNIVKEFVLNQFVGSTSFARLLIEVFIRTHMGRRYYKFSGAIITALVLFFVPMMPKVFPVISSYYTPTFWEIITDFWLWYVFITVFLYFSYLRYKDIKHIRAEFDFNHFSLSPGLVIPAYHNLKFRGKEISPRTREIFIEPLPFFIGGLFFMLIGQKLLGGLFIFCSIVYCISYARAYDEGDNYMLDIIDEIICNEEISRTFETDEPTERGFPFYGEKPSAEELRKRMVHKMTEKEEFSDAV